MNWAAYEEELEKQAARIHMPGLKGVVDPLATVAKPPSPTALRTERPGARGLGGLRNLLKPPRLL